MAGEAAQGGIRLGQGCEPAQVSTGRFVQSSKQQEARSRTKLTSSKHQRRTWIKLRVAFRAQAHPIEHIKAVVLIATQVQVIAKDRPVIAICQKRSLIDPAQASSQEHLLSPVLSLSLSERVACGLYF